MYPDELSSPSAPEPEAASAPPVSFEPESTPVAPAAPEPAPAAPGDDTPLGALASKARLGRLRPEDEEHAHALLREGLAAGGAGLAAALVALPHFSWNLAVAAVAAAWPEMSATAREAFAAGLKREDQRTENARRVRLSIGRGLFKIDQEAAAKVIAAVCREVRELAPEGEPIPRNERRNFDAVMIGKGRPWLCQIPLGEWRPADQGAVVQVAVGACFGGHLPPFTQLSLLRWLSEGGWMEKLPADLLPSILEAVRRWSPKWKASLEKEITPLPEALAAAAAEAGPVGRGENGAGPRRSSEEGADHSDRADANDPERRDEGDANSSDDDGAPRETDRPDDDESTDSHPDDAPAGEAAPSGGRRTSRRERGRLRRLGKSIKSHAPHTAPAIAEADDAEEERERDAREREDDRMDRVQPPAAPSQREARDMRDMRERESREMRRPSGGNGGGGGGDVLTALQTIDRAFRAMRTELDVARANLRQRDDQLRKSTRSGKGRGWDDAPLPDGEVTALRQHQLRLEGTVAELTARLHDLTLDAEDQAASRSAFDPDAATPSEGDQYRSLLGMRLAGARAEFSAMQGRLRDDVFDDNYRTLLDRVFGILADHGVPFPTPEPAATAPEEPGLVQ